MIIKYWCTRFSAESEELREELAVWTRWLANGSPPWAAYRALMTGRLVSKLVHKLTTKHTMEACGSNNLCGGLKAGIEGAIYVSKRAFGKGTPPNAVSSDSHPRGANGLEMLWEGIYEPNDSGEENTDVEALLMPPPTDGGGELTEEEPFNVGKNRGNLQPEENLAGCLLADAANSFNNLSMLEMLWTVVH